MTGTDIAQDLEPHATVIIPCYNCAEFVVEAARSALAQLHGIVQVIVVDDGSTDGSAAEVGQISGIRLVRQPNRGVSAARNAGLALAKARFVVFLDADDRLHVDAIRYGLAEMEGDDGIVMSFGGNRLVDRAGCVTGINVQARCEVSYWDILGGVTPGPSQCIYRRASLERVGGFDTTLRAAEDAELHSRLSRIGKVTCHGHMVSDYRCHLGQATRGPSRGLLGMLDVLRSHRRLYSSGTDDERRYVEAERRWARYYGQYIPSEAARRLLRSDVSGAIDCLALFARHMPASLVGFGVYVRSRVT